MKKIWIIVSLVVLLAIIAGAVYYFINTNAEKNKPNLNGNALSVDKVDNKEIASIPTASTKSDIVVNNAVDNLENTEKIDKNGFKTFSNDDYSIKYKGSYDDGDCYGYTNKCDFFIYSSASNPDDTEWVYGFSVDIGVAIVDNYKEAVTYKFEDAGYFDVSSPKNIIIDKEKAEIYSWSSGGPSGTYNGKDIFVVHNNKFYNISYSYQDFNNSDYSSTIQEMLNSFKFE